MAAFKGVGSLFNIEDVLRAYDLSRGNVIKATVWITDRADFAGFNAAYAQFFAGLPFPARSTVVSTLVVPGARIEIEAIASFQSQN